jgi:hypothetical protein
MFPLGKGHLCTHAKDPYRGGEALLNQIP